MNNGRHINSFTTLTATLKESFDGFFSRRAKESAWRFFLFPPSSLVNEAYFMQGRRNNDRELGSEV